MKKTAGGICAVLLLGVSLFSLRGGVLKAGELETVRHSSETTAPATAPSTELVQEAPTVTKEEPPASQVAEPIAEPTAESAVKEVNPETLTESSELISSTSSEASVTDPTTDSTASSSREITSETSSGSVSESTTSTTSSSITESSTETTTTQETSSSTETSSKEETIPSTESSTSTSTSEEQEQVPPSSEPELETSPPAGVTPVQVPSAIPSTVQAPRLTNGTRDQALSATGTLNLPNEWKAEQLAESDLGLFELPLLSTFERQEIAVWIYGAIKQVGYPQEEALEPVAFFNELYQDLYGTTLPAENQKINEQDLQAGMLLYQSQGEKLVGIYLGNNSYLTLADIEVEKESKDKEEPLEENEESTKSEKSIEPIKERQAVVRLLNELEEDLYAQALPEVQLTAEGQQVLASYPAAKEFRASAATQAFVDSISEDARTLGLEYDVFASVMIAQAILESGSGTSGLSLPPHYNLFGVKGTYQGQSVSFSTSEDRGNGELYQIQSAFRKYPNYAASLGDYVSLLRGGISGNSAFYQPTWRSKAKNYLNATTSLTGSYATDTEYNQKLNSLIAVYHLTEFDRPKATDSSVFIKGKSEIPAEYKERMKLPDYDGKNYNSSGSYPVGQCTWYAYNRVKQLGKSVDEFMGNGGEWGATGQRLGYKVSQQPKAGWLISFSPGTARSDTRYGHVAFVEAVGSEGILISEGNVYGGTIISYRVISNDLARSNQVSYIQPK
ncbi:glucosaminidase domain-containing protein [Candidatus Enterococcus ferrettii]|uniref:Peptidase C51 domain-containing protein n=1 Tax=Candidatus Enterococcus ferrettii TaxID=2815324 RepID=A0ABV0ELY3_9ENTE|nr:glucosaminidase domain-containing protein [Enterococcus sp. 665A]MBO1343118.1 CHAP domain-containing protein [Enterococcus sp. 665A]